MDAVHVAAVYKIHWCAGAAALTSLTTATGQCT